MNSHFLLQAFLVFDIFLAGAVAAEALRHALAHYRPSKHDAEHHEPQGGHLPPAMREKLLADAQTNFESVMHSAARDLQKDLATTAEEIKQEIAKLGEQAKNEELEHYKATVAELQATTKNDITGTDKELAKQKAEMKAKLAEEIAAEKKQLVDQMNTKLADAVASFLTETLGAEVDLGAQSAYLTKMLDEHKDQLAQEFASAELE